VGVPQDLDRARELFRRAALALAEGAPPDYVDEAKYYLRSREVPRLLAEELLPYQEIADGPAAQQYEFALRWRDGQGLPKSREGYHNWLTRSARGGFPPAQHEFGLARLAGEIGILGAFDGVDWIWYAARAGHVPAQADLARHLEIGKGTKPSAVQALAWYLIAQRNGADMSASIERLNGLLTEGERQDARTRAAHGFGLIPPGPSADTSVPPLLRP
jgi:TPR repeat protein